MTPPFFWSPRQEQSAVEIEPAGDEEVKPMTSIRGREPTARHRAEIENAIDQLKCSGRKRGFARGGIGRGGFARSSAKLRQKTNCRG